MEKRTYRGYGKKANQIKQIIFGKTYLGVSYLGRQY
jgi:hypothetical protein